MDSGQKVLVREALSAIAENPTWVLHEEIHSQDPLNPLTYDQ